MGRRVRVRGRALVLLFGVMGVVGYSVGGRWHVLPPQAVVHSKRYPSYPFSTLKWHSAAQSAEISVANGPVLYQKASNVERPIASTTKMMTAYLVLHNPRMSQTRMIGITPADVLNDRQGVLKNDSEVPLSPHQRVSVQDLLWALMLPSADDAAWVLARASAGSGRAFVRQMNRTARTLGMSHTHYVDPDGVNPSGYSTAKDLTRLAAVDMANPTFRHLVSTRVVKTRAFGTLSNLNLLLWQYPGALGIKTGWTPSAGSCLVFAAQRMIGPKKVTLYGVVLNEPAFGPMFHDAAQLLSTGFSVLHYRTVIGDREVVARTKVQGWGAPRSLSFSVMHSLGVVATGGPTTVQFRWHLGRSWKAGQTVGAIRVEQKGWPASGWQPIVANQTFSPPWWAG